MLLTSESRVDKVCEEATQQSDSLSHWDCKLLIQLFSMFRSVLAGKGNKMG